MATNKYASDNEVNFDSLIIGAGISGIGVACHLRMHFPEQQFTVLEELDGFGGTWLTHRYPGARSDSDLFTYAYKFHPWPHRSIATADEIRLYLKDVIDTYELEQRIQYGSRVEQVNWVSDKNHWEVSVCIVATGERYKATTQFLYVCAGIYDHKVPYTPKWDGFDVYEGEVVHPQHWPDDFSFTGKKIAVIGSGATAATLIPALADEANHVTMLQRSPTYFTAISWASDFERRLRELKVPDEWVHEIMRRDSIEKSASIIRKSYSDPEQLRNDLIGAVAARLPEDFDVKKHFEPTYRPWQQRLAKVPDGDLFDAINSGKASVVTDTISHFDEKGIQLDSGEHIEADVVITATGFNLCLFGNIPFKMDGEQVDLTQRVSYRGMMIEGIPNMAYMLGYFRSSWTLRTDMVCEFLMRVLEQMKETNKTVVMPQRRDEDKNMPLLPWTDEQNFNAGYMLRSQHVMYSRSDRMPWMHTFEYEDEYDVLPALSVNDEVLIYS